MILSKEIKIKLNTSNYKRLLSLGYKGKINEEIIIDIKDLALKSHYKILYRCDNCGKEIEIEYHNYNIVLIVVM